MLKISSMKKGMLVLAGVFHAQLAAAGCDIPMFAGARLFGAPIQPQMVISGDFNHDGLPDLAVLRLNATSTITILLNNGDGTFETAGTISQANINWIGSADFNGDGKADLVLSGNPTIIMLSNGDGTFHTSATIGGFFPALAIGDFNGDGKPDLTDGNGVALGKGDGTFQAPVFANGNLAGNFIGPVVVGDFNGDGKLDVIAIDLVPNDLAVLLGDGTGKLSAPTRFSAGTGFTPASLSVADLNGDKKLDVVAYDFIANDFSVLLGNGNGTFQAAVNSPLPAGPFGGSSLGTSMVVADFTGDGIPDLAVSNTTILPFGSGPFGPPTINGTISILPGKGDGSFLAPVQYNPAPQPISFLATADFNGDGRPDLAFLEPVTQAPTEIGVMLGNADGIMQSPRVYPAGDTPASPVLADLNGDGFPDLVLAHGGFNGNVSVMLGNGDGSFQPGVSYPTSLNSSSVALGDVNGDGRPDLIAANAAAGGLLIFLGNGDGTFQAPLPASALFAGGLNVALGDFNNDGKLDAVVGPTLTVFLGNGDGTFRGGSSYGPAAPFQATGPVAVADLNGDGNLDLAVVAGSNPLNGPDVYVLLGNGDGTFRAPVSYKISASGSTPVSLAIGDLNGDGKPDLVVADGSASNTRPGAVAILLGNGDGTFQSAVRYAASGTGASAVALGDFNGDGNLDIAAVSKNDQTVKVLLGVGDGTFRDPVAYGAGIGPVALAIGDLNVDGRPDLLIVDPGLAGVWPLLNNYVASASSPCAAIAPLGN